MKRVLIISLNSGGTMGHGKIISSLSNYLSKKKKEITILSDMPFSNNFDLDKKVKVKNIEMMPHSNYTIGGMCNCIQKEKIFDYSIKNNIGCVIFSTFFDLGLVRKFKEVNVKTILLSYPIRDTYRLALKQNRAYSIFDRVITLYGPCFTDKKMKNEILVNPLKLALNNLEEVEKCDILVTCGGGGRPSSKVFLKKTIKALDKIIKILSNKKLKIIIIKGNSKVDIKNKNIKTLIWTKDFASFLSSSKVVISEAGFYTMLDLINYQKTAILIPGERIIDNQELRALKIGETKIGKVFFPFEKPEKLVKLILKELEDNKMKEMFCEIKKNFSQYPNFEEAILKELK